MGWMLANKDDGSLENPNSNLIIYKNESFHAFLKFFHFLKIILDETKWIEVMED
jgi:hypothetical protein